MVDLKTHRLVDMIESRELEDVSRWLAEYPKLSVVSRDGSLTYASAITASHPNAMQVSDRFHLVKNLTERATLVFQKLFQGRVAIPVTKGTQRIRYEMLIATVPQRIHKVKALHIEGRSKNEIVLLTGLSEQMVRKYIHMREDEIPNDKTTVRGKEHDDAVRKLIERSERVKVMRADGLSLAEISKQTKLTYAVIKNYLSADFSPVNAHYGKQREGKLEPFRDDVMQMRENGLKYRDIHGIIAQKGYTGTQDAIRGFVSKERRIQRDLHAAAGGDSVELIDKKWIIRLLYKPVEKVKGISQDQLSAVFAAYPLAERICNVVSEFKAMLKAKQPDALDAWLKNAAALQCSEINSFINGLQQDITAVKNAMSTDFNNGLAEGTVNKIKLVKRIMYGRCHFDLLRCKCLLVGQ